MHQPVVSHGRAYDNVRSHPSTMRSSKLTSRIANNMHNRHKLSISSRVATVRAKLPWPKSRNEGSGTPTAFDSTVAICSVRSDEFVWVAAEVNAGLADQVEEGKFVVCCSL
jgi:hypothetical protein